MSDSDDFLDETYLTAYHEAGHAAVAVLLGGEVQSVSIAECLQREFNLYGDTRVRWSLAEGQRLSAEIATTLAGPMAEMIYRDELLNLEEVREWDADVRLANQLCRQVASTQDVGRVYSVATTRLETWMRTEGVWAAVAALADELLAHETLEGEQVDEIVGFWKRHAATLHLTEPRS